MPEEKDSRIDDAEEIRKLLGVRGFKVLLGRWQEIKDKAHADLLDETLSDDTLKARQTIYNQVSEWIEIPTSIIQAGKDAVEDIDKEKDRKEHPIKKAVAFMGRKY